MKKIPHVGYKPLILGIFFFLIAVQVYLLNSISTNGSKLNVLENEITTISKENDDLEEAIASASSVTTISTKAHLIGLTVSPTSLAIQNPLPVALLDLSPN